MALDLNKEENQFELIPSGTRTVVRMKINPPDPKQKCTTSPALTQSASSDAQYMNCEFELLSGPFKGKKVFQNYTIAGGKKDSNGNSIAGRITGTFLKAAWDAAHGLMPTDMSHEAVQKRMVKDYTEFHDIVFPVIISIKEQSNGYAPRNEIYRVITPDKSEYADLMAGKDVPPMDLGILSQGGKKKATGGAVAAATKPAWAQDAPAASSAPETPAAAPVNPTDNLSFNKPVTQQADNRPAWAR